MPATASAGPEAQTPSWSLTWVQGQIRECSPAPSRALRSRTLGLNQASSGLLRPTPPRLLPQGDRMSGHGRSVFSVPHSVDVCLTSTFCSPTNAGLNAHAQVSAWTEALALHGHTAPGGEPWGRQRPGLGLRESGHTVSCSSQACAHRHQRHRLSPAPPQPARNCSVRRWLRPFSQLGWGWLCPAAFMCISPTGPAQHLRPMPAALWRNVC